jgi:hypothetical protein
MSKDVIQFLICSICNGDAGKRIRNEIESNFDETDPVCSNCIENGNFLTLPPKKIEKIFCIQNYRSILGISISQT